MRGRWRSRPSNRGRRRFSQRRILPVSQSSSCPAANILKDRDMSTPRGHRRTTAKAMLRIVPLICAVVVVASRVPADIGNLGFVSPAHGQSAAVTPSQSDALNSYNKAVNDFKSILSQRRAQINSNQQLPGLPGQALYLARNNMISAYKDLTDAVPSKI